MSNTTWVNKDGLVVRFGETKGVRGSKAGVTAGAGKERELVFEVTLTGAARTVFTMDRNNDGTLDGFSGLDDFIPAGALIKGFDVLEIVAPAGGTNYTVGTWQVDGTAIDDDGIRTTLGAAGAQVATTIAQKGYVSVKTAGTYTAGKIQVVVRFVTV